MRRPLPNYGILVITGFHRVTYGTVAHTFNDRRTQHGEDTGPSGGRRHLAAAASFRAHHNKTLSCEKTSRRFSRTTTQNGRSVSTRKVRDRGVSRDSSVRLVNKSRNVHSHTENLRERP